MTSVPAVNNYCTLPGATPPAPPPNPSNSDYGTKDTNAAPANQASKSSGVNILV